MPESSIENLQPASSDSFKPGDLLVGGKYTILCEAGSGGMGFVYKAQQAQMHRIVALKVLRPNCASDPNRVMRFFKEGRILSKIEHENIARVFAVENLLELQIPMIVLEWLEGRTLEAEIERCGKLEPDLVVAIAKQVCAALDYAHQMGIIHRDLKPSNVFLCDRPGLPPQAKLIDFGLARLVMQSLEESAGQHQRITKTGEFLGTPAYISPEQCLTGVAEERSDLYSLACIMYQCLTGNQPFQGDSMLEVLNKHLCEPFPAIGAGCPGRLEDVIRKAGATEPAERFSSAAEMALALSVPDIVDEQIVASPGQTTQSTGNGKPKMPFMICFLRSLLILTVVAAAVTVIWSPEVGHRAALSVPWRDPKFLASMAKVSQVINATGWHCGFAQRLIDSSGNDANTAQLIEAYDYAIKWMNDQERPAEANALCSKELMMLLDEGNLNDSAVNKIGAISALKSAPSPDDDRLFAKLTTAACALVDHQQLPEARKLLEWQIRLAALQNQPDKVFRLCDKGVRACCSATGPDKVEQNIPLLTHFLAAMQARRANQSDRQSWRPDRYSLESDATLELICICAKNSKNMSMRNEFLTVLTDLRLKESGKKNAATLQWLFELGNVRTALKQYKLALETHQALRTLAEKANLEWPLALALMSLGNDRTKLSELAKGNRDDDKLAYCNYKDALSHMDNLNLGSTPPALNIEAGEADALWRLGTKDEAIALYRDMLVRARKMLPPSPAAVLRSTCCLAQHLQDKGGCDEEARKYFYPAYQQLKIMNRTSAKDFEITDERFRAKSCAVGSSSSSSQGKN
jgi:serine/threonine protein kinase